MKTRIYAAPAVKGLKPVYYCNFKQCSVLSLGSARMKCIKSVITDRGSVRCNTVRPFTM